MRNRTRNRNRLRLKVRQEKPSQINISFYAFGSSKSPWSLRVVTLEMEA